MERRLSAILSADIVGYSRLMGANEVGTLNALNHRRGEVLEPEIANRSGRIFKLTGDGMLVEFPSVVDAVECAVSIQDRLAEANHDSPEDRRIEMRIGISLGDVIAQDGDIYGDGVNLAARIETVARPGGIAVSQSVCEHVGNRANVRFEDLGTHQLKNIAGPTRVYEVVPATASSAPGKGRAATSVSPEAGKPSIAVLPFNNLSGDPEQDYFSEGITEDIITDLSKISGLFVVGRHTSFAFKDKSHPLDKVALDLGVRYLLEGSVRTAGKRLRVTGQLIEGATGGHLWADRYDRELTDIFAIQDEITHAIVDQLKVRLLPDERTAIGQAPTSNVEAYNCYLKGRQFFHNATKYFLGLARQLFVRATELDPQFARAFAGIANCDARLIGWYGEPIPEQQVLANADMALALDSRLAEAHAARADALSFFGRLNEAEREFEVALSLDPNSFDTNFLYARFWLRNEEPERAAELFIRALEVQPEDCQAPLQLQALLRGLGRMEESVRYGELGIKRAEEALRQHPEWSRPAQLGAASLAGMGRVREAQEWISRALAIDPNDNLALYNAACTWAQLGDVERAFELLERWAPNAGVEKRYWLKVDNDFDPIRQDPRFQQLVREVDPSPAG